MWSFIAVLAGLMGLGAIFPFVHQEYLEWKLKRAFREAGLTENDNTQEAA